MRRRFIASTRQLPVLRPFCQGRVRHRDSSENVGINVAAGVEQLHIASCLGTLPCDVRTLCIVAHRARVAQVVQCSLTIHRPRNKVVDFERLGIQLLLQLAVFAADLRSLGLRRLGEGTTVPSRSS
jgi:hypothetical protein